MVPPAVVVAVVPVSGLHGAAALLAALASAGLGQHGRPGRAYLHGVPEEAGRGGGLSLGGGGGRGRSGQPVPIGDLIGSSVAVLFHLPSQLVDFSLTAKGGPTGFDTRIKYLMQPLIQGWTKITFPGCVNMT